ncbi:hypothetical protein DPM19_30735 [Actinomadura craniellae]|uniref:AAA+ ATPase domain-containing protein n=1 Tax=Actinomadura craniellae TaxID=2231787 RepID=A0A365GX82_9ACTN|nr:tetratricopeptide repeat protein [Actinomadura craniellae]RAY11402.1 hypothetical protein DPM19_30735 [Actinomadura craniellae]
MREAPARPGRRAERLTAPWAVGGVTAVVTGMTTALGVLPLSQGAQLGVVGGASALAGLMAWAVQRVGGESGPAELPGPQEMPPPAQLPPVAARFTGRTESLRELERVHAEHPRDGKSSAPLVVSLHGPAGVGKSALATKFAHQVAADFPDGQLYFDLRGHGDARVRPEEVLIGFLQALGVRLTTDPGDLMQLQKLWWTWVRGKRLLVFLDNAHDAEQVQALIPPMAGCAVLVTSRQPLYLRNTYDRRLREFTPEQSLVLLGRLADGDDEASRVAAEPEAAEEIVELCGRLPLALSICGGRLNARKHWSLREMADRLGDERRRRLDELEITQRIDQSVRASLQLSYDDCTADQRRLLRAFALLAAPDVQDWVAGELLGVDHVEGCRLLEALENAQLVEFSSRDATGTLRYRLHDLVRLYARERTEREDSAADRRAALERVLDGYRERAERAAFTRWPQDWPGRPSPRTPRLPDQPPTEWLTSERPALLAMLDQAVELEMWERVWRLGRATCSLFHSLRIFWSEWRAVAELTCAAAERTDDSHALAVALLERQAVAGGQGRIDQARTYSETALEIFTERAEPWWRARALRAVGMCLRDAGNLDGGQRYLLEAIAEFEHLGDVWWRSRTQRNLAELRLAQRRIPEAKALADEALTAFQQNGNRYSEAQTMRTMGDTLAAEARGLHAAGEHRVADARFFMAASALERAAEAFRLRGEQWEQARCLRSGGDVGDPRNGLRELALVRRATLMLMGLGDTWGLARTRITESRALRRLGRHDEAVATMAQAVEAFRELGDRWWQARSLRGLAEALLAAGRAGDAVAPAEQALEIYRSLGNMAGETRARAVLEQARAAGPS